MWIHMGTVVATETMACIGHASEGKLIRQTPVKSLRIHATFKPRRWKLAESEVGGSGGGGGRRIPKPVTSNISQVVCVCADDGT
ncbi:hypothetical protein M0804_012507 [Polistes exclamans]|nr:hypothetical protein M0804_012507 [Polistes exclamans]